MKAYSKQACVSNEISTSVADKGEQKFCLTIIVVHCYIT